MRLTCCLMHRDRFNRRLDLIKNIISKLEERARKKLSLFEDNMIFTYRNPKDSIKKIVRSNQWIQYLQDTKLIHKHGSFSIHEYHFFWKRNKFIYKRIKNNKIFRTNLNKEAKGFFENYNSLINKIKNKNKYKDL